MRFLFWNINRKQQLLPLLAEAASEHNPDVVVLVENPISQALAIRSLPGFRFPAFSLADRVQLFFRIDPERCRTLYENPWLMAANLTPPAADPLLLIALHLPSKLFVDSFGQMTEASKAVKAIQQAEAVAGHQRTIVVGDFNMNPFEPGIVGADGFHAFMDRRDARDRTIRGVTYSSFYNPMWSRFGDLTPGSPGTHYYRGDMVSFHWNMFDQVLLRPALAQTFSADHLNILDRIGDVSLVDSNGRPSRAFSDHLPILFEVN